MKILMCCFSATGNTAVIGRVIESHLSRLGAAVDTVDVTLPSAREKPMDLTPYDGVLFGAPIHSMRAPRVVREWMTRLQGHGKKCAMFFTYGGFQVHPTHSTTREILRGRNFQVVASAEFLGRHTFNLGGWRAVEERPDESDFIVARDYAERVFNRFLGEDPEMVKDLDPGPYTDAQLDDFEKFRYMMVSRLPTREGAECRMCGLCEELCPSGAMDMERGRADGERCIVCLRCVKECPDEILTINDLRPFYDKKMERDGETEESLRAKKSRMYL